MRAVRRLACAGFGLISLGLLAGCSSDELLDKFTTAEDKARASGFIQNLRDGRLELIEASLDPALNTPDLRATLEKMHKSIPNGPPDSVKLVGVNSGNTNGVHFSNLTYEYQFGSEWLLINCATRVDGEKALIVGLNVNRLDQSIEAQNRFSLAGKSPMHYLMLVAMAMAAGVSLFALIRCARQKGLRKKWAWVLFILLGFITVSLNWNTGAWLVKPLSFLVFSAGASAAPYGPWEFSVALPLGALVYLIRHARNHNAAAQSNPEPIS